MFRFFVSKVIQPIKSCWSQEAGNSVDEAARKVEAEDLEGEDVEDEDDEDGDDGVLLEEDEEEGEGESSVKNGGGIKRHSNN